MMQQRDNILVSLSFQQMGEFLLNPTPSQFPIAPTVSFGYKVLKPDPIFSVILEILNQKLDLFFFKKILSTWFFVLIVLQKHKL